MKNTYLYWLLIFSTTLLIYSSCTNDSQEDKPPQQEEKPLNTPPIAKAGADQIITLPVNSVILNGSDSTDDHNDIRIYFWKKIQGPDSFSMSTPNTIQTTVSNLVEGVYIFELTVADFYTTTSTDQCTVTVLQNRIYLKANDIRLILPTNFCWLEANYSNSNPIKEIVWKKISGPSNYIIESPNSLNTKVSKLEKGIYEFELSVTDKYNQTTKETAKITVGEIPANPTEKIFNNLNWLCPWDCSIEIPNFPSQLPSGSAFFKVYIQRDSSANWMEVLHWSTDLLKDQKYIYYLDSDHLYIYPTNYDNFNEKDTHNIKIVY